MKNEVVEFSSLFYFTALTPIFSYAITHSLSRSSLEACLWLHTLGVCFTGECPPCHCQLNGEK
jgi:hypothetical protein